MSSRRRLEARVLTELPRPLRPAWRGGGGRLSGWTSLSWVPHHRSGQSLSADSVLTRGDEEHLSRGKPQRL